MEKYQGERNESGFGTRNENGSSMPSRGVSRIFERGGVQYLLVP